MNKTKFLTNAEVLRDRVSKNLEDGAVTPGYAADRKRVIEMLNTALATELICVLRYKRHYHMAEGLQAEKAAEEFQEHAIEEQEHADQLAKRIVQLGGEPQMNPDLLSEYAHSRYDQEDKLENMIKEDLIAERIAIESYREMIQFIGNDDPVTRRMLEGILETEEEHADDMAGLLPVHASSKQVEATV